VSIGPGGGSGSATGSGSGALNVVSEEPGV
jgi:hypothetical protein